MKRSHALLGSTLFLAMAPCAYADGVADCFPMCPEPAASVPETAPNACAFGVVREVARIDRDLEPLKKAVGAITNPTGFALEQVDKHVVHIPPWVGYAIDPRGALRSAVIKRARDEAKKAVGLENGCA
jgi:hypothetical protein